MKDYHINIFYSDEDEGYIADIPDLKGCSAFGNTQEEALKEVLLAKSAWIEAAMAEGISVPTPRYSKSSSAPFAGGHVEIVHESPFLS